MADIVSKKKRSENMSAIKSKDTTPDEQLTNSGIRVLIVWECSIRQMRKDPLNAINDFNKIKTFLESQQSFDEL